MPSRPTPHILLVSSDRSLREELEQALDAVEHSDPVLHVAESLRRGGEVAQSRRPELVIAELDASGRELARFAEELAAFAPECTVAATFRADAFGPDESESAAIIASLRAGVRDFLQRPLSASEVGQLVDRVPRADRESKPSRRRGRVVSFASNKGGVGKSTLSVNLACELARSGAGRVLLVDAALQLGICAQLLDLEPRATLVDAVRELGRLDETLLRELTVRHDSGLDLLAAPRDAIEAAEVEEEHVARILSIARRAWDYVVVDTFPVLDGTAIAILDLSDVSYLVFQGTVPSIAGQRHFLEVLGRVGLPPERQRLVLSRNHARAGSAPSVAEIERHIGRSVDHVVPYSSGVIAATNSGEPYILGRKRPWGFGRAVRRMARRVREEKAATTATSRARTEAGRGSEPDEASDARGARDPGLSLGERRSPAARLARSSHATIADAAERPTIRRDPADESEPRDVGGSEGGSS